MQIPVLYAVTCTVIAVLAIYMAVGVVYCLRMHFIQGKFEEIEKGFWSKVLFVFAVIVLVSGWYCIWQAQINAKQAEK